MWHWLKHWRDWAMAELSSALRTRPAPQGLHLSYEKAGQVIHDQPIPWNADAVLVEAALRLPPSARRKGDFFVRFAGSVEAYPAENLRKHDEEERWHLFFRLPPIPGPVVGELLWKSRPLAPIRFSFISEAEFVRQLSIVKPTLFAGVGKHSIAARTFVASQCKGLFAVGTLKSNLSLAPLADGLLRIGFRSQRTAATEEIPLILTAGQLAATEAILHSASSLKVRKTGEWSAVWSVGNQPLAEARARGIGRKAFHESLRVVDTRFLVVDKADRLHLCRQLPPMTECKRIGPCFLLASNEVGMIGEVVLRVCAQVPGTAPSPVLQEQSVLITDGLLRFMPGTLAVEDLGRATGFELRVHRRVLEVLPLSPVPTATFNSEGGYRPTPDYTWTPIAEEQLSERLARLMNQDPSLN